MRGQRGLIPKVEDCSFELSALGALACQRGVVEVERLLTLLVTQIIFLA